MQLKIAELSDIDNVLKLHAKYQIQTIQEFSFNNNHYYELVYETAKSLKVK